MPDQHQLLKTQANDVLAIVMRHGFDPSAFRWSIEPSMHGQGTASRLTHTPTSSFYLFDNGGGPNNRRHVALFSPGPSEISEHRYFNLWAAHYGHCESWIAALRREVDAPDLWASVQGERALWEATESTKENTPLSIEEAEQVRVGIHEIRQFLLQIAADNKTHQAIVERRLDYLMASARRVGRIDWVNLAVGAIVSIVVQLGLTPEAGHEVLRMAGQLLSWVVTERRVLPA
jgi:hypothetical protein